MNELESRKVKIGRNARTSPLLIPLSDDPFVIWEKRAVLMCAFGFVGIGALFGVGAVYKSYISRRLEKRFGIQSVAGSKLSNVEQTAITSGVSTVTFAPGPLVLVQSNVSLSSRAKADKNIDIESKKEAEDSTRSLTKLLKPLKSAVKVKNVPTIPPQSQPQPPKYTTKPILHKQPAKKLSSSKGTPAEQSLALAQVKEASAKRKPHKSVSIVAIPQQVLAAEPSTSTTPRSSKGFLPADSDLNPPSTQPTGDIFQFQQFFTKIDELLEGSKSDKHEAYTLLKTNFQKLGDHCDFLWRLSRATHMESVVAAQQQDTETQKTLLLDAVSCAEKAMKLNDNSADAHKWYAITLGNQSSFMKIKEKILIGFTFKEHIERAISLNPLDSFLHHLLGRFCFEVSQLSWMEKKMAAALFSSPPTSTVQESLAHFLRSDSIGKPEIENSLFIARCYIQMSENKKAAHHLHIASSLTPVSFDEKKAHTAVMELYPKYKKYL